MSVAPKLGKRGPEPSHLKLVKDARGVRYTRKKLPIALPRGRVEIDSWDMSPFKTPSEGRHFLRRNTLFGIITPLALMESIQ